MTVAVVAFILANVTALMLMVNFQFDVGTSLVPLAIIGALALALWRRSSIARAVAVFMLFSEAVCLPPSYFTPHRLIGKRHPEPEPPFVLALAVAATMVIMALIALHVLGKYRSAFGEKRS